MKLSFHQLSKLAVIAVLLSIGAFATVAYANHSWGGYHWARIANPFTLELGDNVSTVWDKHLATSSLDWSESEVLDTNVVTGLTNPKNCKAVKGRVEICNNKYGRTGWLGIASVWVSGDHITQGTVKLNDTYFNTVKYNTPAWRQLVVCQEVGHTLGLDHQDEIFDNLNLGTCMDYTNDPDGSLFGQLDNQHLNTHDYEELNTIYAHLDTFTTIFNNTLNKISSAHLVEDNDENIDTSDSEEWGRMVKQSNNGRSSLHERNLGKGQKLFTFVIWAE